MLLIPSSTTRCFDTISASHSGDPAVGRKTRILYSPGAIASPRAARSISSNSFLVFAVFSPPDAGVAVSMAPSLGDAYNSNSRRMGSGYLSIPARLDSINESVSASRDADYAGASPLWCEVGGRGGIRTHEGA